MYAILWEYQVKEDCLAKFESIYAANGVWAELVRNGEGYLGTELLRDPGQPLRFVRIDRWASAEDCDVFKSNWKDEYEMLDEKCNGLTESESLIGEFLLVKP